MPTFQKDTSGSYQTYGDNLGSGDYLEFSPADNATGVAVNEDLIITFDEAVQ